jgi:hypothetical protein
MRLGTWPRTLLYAAVALVLVLAATRAWICWTRDAEISHASGVVMAMADDLQHGVFYRPLFGRLGYGGTRYFPLFFVIHAGLLKLGMPVLASGYLLCGAAVALLMVGTYRLLTTLKVEPWLAACSTAALLAAGSAQLSVVSPHPDGLASALNVWGLAVIAQPRRDSRKVLLAAVLFTLAWSAKFTSVFGLAAAFVWLLSTGLPQTAWRLAGETLCGYVLVAGAMVLASQGRVVEIFKACVSGGASMTMMLAGPWNMVMVAAQGDRGLFLFVLLALVALVSLAVSGNILQNLPVLFFIGAMVVTAVIFGSPGTNNNHLLDVQVAGVILFATWLAGRPVLMQKQWGVCALALAILVAALPLWRHIKAWDLPYHPNRFQNVLALAGDTQKPLLSENPILPVLAGQPAYVLDAWMVQLLRKRTPRFAEPLLEGVRDRRFSAVVLMKDPETSFGKRWYETTSYGPGFVSAVTQNYRLSAVLDDQRVYLPTAADSQLAGNR